MLSRRRAVRFLGLSALATALLLWALGGAALGGRLAAEIYPPARIITKVRLAGTGPVRFCTTERGSPCPAA
jgi:hypothetical protein